MQDNAWHILSAQIFKFIVYLFILPGAKAGDSSFNCP